MTRGQVRNSFPVSLAHLNLSWYRNLREPLTYCFVLKLLRHGAGVYEPWYYVNVCDHVGKELSELHGADGTTPSKVAGEFLDAGDPVMSTAGTRPQPGASEEVLQVQPRRGQMEVHLQPGDFLDPAASIAEPSPDRLVMDDLTDMSLEGNILRKISVKVVDMRWGGEVVENPCQSVFGYVLRMCADEEGAACLEVDFGDDLGI